MSITTSLLLPREYVTEATELIRQAKTRVSFISMVLADDASTNSLIDALADAAHRGLEVHVAGDMFTYTELSGQFIPSHYYSKKVRSTTRMTRKLTEAGVRFHWLGRLDMTTFSGRTHSKWCVVDDTVFSFGGVNLYEKALQNTDYMLKVVDPELASNLVREHQRIVRADKDRMTYKSHSLKVDEDSRILFDAGLFGDSLIYSRVCALTREASHVVLVSQYCPTGKLSKLLKQTSSTLYFNPWQHATGFNAFIIRLGMALTKQVTHYTRPEYLHAKCMLFTMKDGSRVAITGSHNFVHGGALLGTREIALETRDPQIIRQLEQFITTHVTS